MNFVGLGWFGKLPYNGHLWFITMIIFCYIMYTTCCKYLSHKNIGGIWYLLLFICIVLQVLLDSLHLPGYMFIILWYSLWIFYNSSKVSRWIQTFKWYFLIPVTIVLNGIAIAICMHSHTFGSSMTALGCYLAGYTLFLALMKAGKHVRTNKLVMFLSSTGYEIYLVHHCLTCGTFSIIRLTHHEWLNYVLLCLISFVLGWVLHKIGDRINSTFKKIAL